MFTSSLSSGFWRRGVWALVSVVVSVAMIATSFEVQARRLGGGMSMGRQSAKAMTAPRIYQSPSQTRATANKNTATSAAAAGRPGARSGLSRWLGPIAGIAAGLGLAALLSHLGLSGALAEFMSVLLLVLLVGAGLCFILRRLRGKTVPAGMQGAYSQATYASNTYQSDMSQPSITEMKVDTPSFQPETTTWGIPSDFDTPRFLEQAKAQFVHIQGIWDSGDRAQLREYLTDDFILELEPQLAQRQERPHQTEVVLLNAELLGIETVANGRLASVRFSGMLREQAEAEAAHFEEIWNLFKSDREGWLLAGIQQVPAATVPPVVEH